MCRATNEAPAAGVEPEDLTMNPDGTNLIVLDMPAQSPFVTWNPAPASTT